MTGTKGIITLITLATILIAGGLTIAPVAYSTGGGDDSHGCGDDSHGDDSHGKDCNPEPDCDCKKPTVFSVIYSGPGIEGVETGPDAEVTVEIYKKVDHIDEKDPLLTIEGIFDGESIIIDSNVYGKKKIHSSTVYRVIQNDVEIAVISFHTSCSQPLFIGDIHSDGPVTVVVESGVDHKDRQSIFLPVDPICNEVPVITPATITLKKVVTQDNTDELLEIADEDIASNFPLFITNILPDSEAIPITMEKQEVPPGTYTLGEDMPVKFEFVLITGDADCPTILDMEEFTISEGQHLTCVVYNDDDADAGESAGGPGVVFHFETIMLEFTFVAGSAAADGGPADCAATVDVAPCIAIIDEKNFIVRPDLSMAPQDLTPTTLILLTVVPANDFSLATQCNITGLNTDGVGDIDGFGVNCLDTSLAFDPLSNDYNFNLALIETLKP